MTSCGSPTPPVVSGDTYCDRARYIQATKDQADEMLGNEQKWRALVEQIADHNDTYKAAKCVGKTATVTVGNPIKAGAPDAATPNSPSLLSRIGTALHL